MDPTQTVRPPARSPVTYLAPAAGVLLMIVLLWPMLKGTFYRYTDRGTGQPGGPVWRTDYAAALRESAQTGKPVLIDFSASWCPPCQVMKHEVWPDAQLTQEVERNFIPLMLDVDVAQSREPAQRYQISSIPQMLVVDSKGAVVRRASYMSLSQTRDFLKGSDSRGI